MRRNVQLATRSAILAIGIVLYIAVAIWVQTRFNNQLPSDIAIYLEAGRKLSQGRNPYQPFQIGASFIYPPPVLLLFSVLSQLPLLLAKHIWVIINIAFYLASLAAIWVSVRTVARKNDRLKLVPLLFLYAPFLETLTVGQVNCLVLLGLAVFVYGYTGRQSWLGDIGLAVAIVIKITPLMLLALPLASKDWQRCMRIALAMVALSVLSIVFYGLTPWLSFFEILPDLLQGYSRPVNQTIMPSIGWLVERILPGISAPLWLESIFSIILIGVWIGSVFRWNTRVNPLATASLGVVTMTISSSLIWYHHLLFLVISLMHLTLGDLGRQSARVPALAWLGLIFIQIDRYIEVMFRVPPFCSIAGYLLIYLACLSSLVIDRYMKQPCAWQNDVGIAQGATKTR